MHASGIILSESQVEIERIDSNRSESLKKYYVPDCATYLPTYHLKIHHPIIFYPSLFIIIHRHRRRNNVLFMLPQGVPPKIGDYCQAKDSEECCRYRLEHVYLHHQRSPAVTAFHFHRLYQLEQQHHRRRHRHR